MQKIFKESVDGYFGEAIDGKHSFGGQYVPEILHPALKELEHAYRSIFCSQSYKDELEFLFESFVGRPTPLIYAQNASQILKNEVYLKFEGLANTGAHKINNALGQVLLAKYMGKKRVIAETGAGQHGLATASACAKLGLECEIFMGEIDVARQRPNVFNMELFGAKVRSVGSGSKTLKDAVNEALREWSKRSEDSFYVLGSALGPYPYPDIVRDLQSVISYELKLQTKKFFEGSPDVMVACVGGGSNAMGFFAHYLSEDSVRLVGVEAGGVGSGVGKNAIRIRTDHAREGIAQGYKSIFLQDSDGQLSHTHSISAGLDYAGIGPQLAHLSEIGRVEFSSASDEEALEALQFFATHEGIIPALESSHALAGVLRLCANNQGKKIIVNVSGRGDKDIFITAKVLNPQSWKAFLLEEIERIDSQNF